MPQRSSKRYQSPLLRARRETSSPSTIPTWPRATSAVRRAKPPRLPALAPERPRSSAMTTTRAAGRRDGEAGILVDDHPAVRGPGEAVRTLGEGVLAGGGFAVMLDLAGGRLA